MARFRHRRASSGADGFARWFAAAALLLAFAATIPLGSVGFLASRLVAAMAWTLGVAGIAWRPPRDEGRADSSTRLAKGALVVLLGWCGWQLCPLPERWASLVWRGDGELLRQIAADAQGFSIALDRFVSLHTLLLWAGLGVLAWACSRQIRGRPLLPFALSGLVVLGVVQSLLGIFVMKDPGGRISGTFGSPDALGGLLAMTLPLALGLVFYHSNQRVLRGRTGFQWWFHRLGDDWRAWRNPVLWLAMGIQWTALYFTGSMGASLAAGAAFGVLLVWQGKERPEFRGRLVAMGLVLAVLLVAVGLNGRSRNVLDRALGDSGEFQKSRNSRVEIWRAAAKLCRAFPWGTGPGGTALALPMYQGGVHGRYRLDYAHNDTLQFLGDLGPAGFGALGLLLGLVLWRGARACRSLPDGGSSSVWLRRGAWVAVLVALGHAQVEFNLSARPGIQVVFALLCGVLWGSQREGGGRSPSASTDGKRRWKAFEKGMLAAGAAAVSLSLAAAWAWRLHEGAVAATGLAPDEHLWFRRPLFESSEAVEALTRASRLAPGFSTPHLTRAEARMALHDQQVRQTALSVRAAAETDPADEGILDAMNPADEEALSLARVALRVEEVERLRAALEDADAAVRLAPWEAMARLARAKILFRGSALKQFGAVAGSRGRRDVEIAVKLYPLDAGVLADACSVLARRSRQPGDLEDLLDWGSRALEMDASLAWTVLDSWRVGKVPVSRILNISRLPISSLWSLYTLLDKQNRREDARRCLVALDRCLAEARPPESSSLWNASTWKRWGIQQTQYRIRLSNEWLKRHLREGDWEGLGSLAESRAQFQKDRFQVELDKMELAGTASVVLRRLRLREWEASRGLSPEWTLEWGLLELEAGMPARQLQEPMAEVILLDGMSAATLGRLRECSDALADAPFLAGLLDAKVLEAAGQADAAVSALTVLRDSGTVPARFIHRILLWQADLLRQAGKTAEAVEALREAAMACPSDPDVEAALEQCGEVPVSGLTHGGPDLDIGFRGGQLRLRHACLEGDADETNGFALHLVWRFRGGLPPDLKMEVRVRGGEGRLLARKALSVDKEVSARFNRGNPPVGSQWTWTIPLPPSAESGKQVEVFLMAAEKRLVSDEGLGVVELSMPKLPRVKSPRAESGAKDGDPLACGGCVRWVNPGPP